MLEFGTYPTPVECLEPLSTAKATLWVKRDDFDESNLRREQSAKARAVAG